MMKKRSKKDTKDSLAVIRGLVPWRCQRDDPTIFISTSWKHFFSVFPKDHRFIQYLLKDHIHKKRTPKKIPVLDKIKEQIQLLNLPIQFLLHDNKDNPKNWSDHNVIFLLPSTLQSKDPRKDGSIALMQTVPLAYPNLTAISDHYPVQYKMIIGSPLKEPATPDTIYAFLHEVIGHGILGEKHFHNSTLPEDRAPFAKKPLDCSQTVMAYRPHCKAYVWKTIELLGERTLKRDDPHLSPKDKQIIEEIESTLPTEMGKLDKILAEKWKIDSKKCSGRFFKSSDQPHDTENTSPTAPLDHSELFTSDTYYGKKSITSKATVNDSLSLYAEQPLILMILIIVLGKIFSPGQHRITSTLFPPSNQTTPSQYQSESRSSNDNTRSLKHDYNQ